MVCEIRPSGPGGTARRLRAGSRLSIDNAAREYLADGTVIDV